jgi:hypothetical protein
MSNRYEFPEMFVRTANNNDKLHKIFLLFPQIAAVRNTRITWSNNK